MRQQYAWRSKFLMSVLGLLAFLVVVQIVRIQNSEEAAIFRQRALNYATESKTFYPDRGNIYDRNGHLLAGNKTVYEVGVNLNDVKDANAIAMTLSVQLGVDYAETLNNIINPPIPDLVYLVITKSASVEDAVALQQLQLTMQEQAPAGTSGSLTGLEFTAHPQRDYPEGALASNIIGFVNRAGRGYFGVEEKYNDLLAGNPVQVLVPTDPNKAEDIPHIPDGTNLVLTINRDLQAAAEETLDGALFTYGAQGGTIIVMNPRNGEVLAMAVTPRMDLNRFWDYEVVYQNASEFNRAISVPYEPGSVTKILTMAAALDSGTVSPTTTFLDTGSILIGGVTIKNWNEEAWGLQDMTGCLQHSLNVCMAWISTQMGTQTFYGYMNRFGLGHLTNIDMAGESAGRLKVPGDEDWYPVDLGTNAFGQGVASTPIQLLAAASSIANDGRMISPHILYSMLREDRQYNASAQYAGAPISSETARTLSNMLATSLENEASLALVSGYRMAGKTGTAQIPMPYGYYDSTRTNASFIGWGPVDDPQFMIYVWLESPSSSIWGSETAAPVFSEMAQKTVILLNVPPDSVRQQLVLK
ncbi:MAG: penicillin-binding protein 2 [Anaerolineales bacterium]|nr:penicillin-binding protein 2 [Anaerolineales bacterium]